MSDPVQKPSAAQAYIISLENALSEIGDLVGVSFGSTDPDTIRRRVKDVRTERDTAQARVKELEAKIAGDVASNAAREMRIKDLEDELLKVRASKCLDAMDASAGPVMLNVDEETAAKLKEEISNLSSAGIVVEPATDPAHAELAQIWELWGAGRPMTPGCVYEAAQEMERANTKLQMKIGGATEHLDSAGIPKFYGHDQNPKGNPVPFEERVALLAEAYKDASWMRDKWRDGTQNAATEIDDAHTELTALGAPRRAGDLALSLAASIRALPDLLRP